jgi:hypothetical protein
MSNDVVPITVRAVLPTNAGSAVFLGNEEKVFVIYVERTVGDAIMMFLRGTSKPRPLTHDLIGHMLGAFGAKVERVVINDLRDGVYYARLIISAENELHQRKIVELDGRPSDSVAIAMQAKAEVFVARAVWNEVDDMSAILQNMSAEEQGGGQGSASELPGGAPIFGLQDFPGQGGAQEEDDEDDDDLGDFGFGDDDDDDDDDEEGGLDDIFPDYDEEDGDDDDPSKPPPF